jgi:N-acetylglucosamine-6-phosphate deacetylase
MIESIQNLIHHTDLSLDEILRMCTLYPAKAIGVDDKLGSIAVGKVANLAIFDQQFKVKATAVNGELQWH